MIELRNLALKNVKQCIKENFCRDDFSAVYKVEVDQMEEKLDDGDMRRFLDGKCREYLLKFERALHEWDKENANRRAMTSGERSRALPNS